MVPELIQILTLAFTLIFTLTAYVGGVEIHVDTVEGEQFTGELIAFGDEGLTLQRDGEVTATLPLDSIVHLAPQTAAAEMPGSGMQLRLVGGSEIYAQQFTTQDQQSIIIQTGELKQTIDTRSVRSVRLRSPSEEFNDRWQELSTANYETDVVIVRKANGTLDFVKGIVEQVGETHVTFQFDGQTIQVAREKIEGIVFFSTQEQGAGDPLCRVATTDGGLVRGRSIELQKTQFVVTTASGVVLQIPVELVRGIDFASGKMSYLSDLEPASVAVQPRVPSAINERLTALLYQPQRDQAIQGGTLFLEFPGDELTHREFAKGLALHSRTEMVWRIDGQYRRLKSIAGIDPRVRDEGYVKLVIAGDGKTIWEGDVMGTSPPQTIDIDISGVRRLSILVDYGDQTDIADHLNLCDLRVTK